ncbi:hypothetical protein ABZX74_28815 [Streptomyces olivaceoviridis]|uniref:hypothetical protein n=1 Tax=Streptomyces olivaceoviridis TaxID=1921 RepID=UPI0033A13B71
MADLLPQLASPISAAYLHATFQLARHAKLETNAPQAIFLEHPNMALSNSCTFVRHRDGDRRFSPSVHTRTDVRAAACHDPRPVEEWIHSNEPAHEAIISPDLFDTARTDIFGN